ncbi:MAG: acyl carrier protein [Firmicutes bacterium]|nr:acyl carrier protein [Bacillota bacterium]
MEEIYKRVNKVFCEVFDDDTIVVCENTTSSDIEDWDSLEHINLIVAIENEFGIKFGMNEVTSMKNVGEMVNLINEKI